MSDLMPPVSAPECIVCPCCLERLSRSSEVLICDRCGSFKIRDEVPIMLVADENWDKKQDEIAGEVAYNTKSVSAETHTKRNAFINQNTRDLLSYASVDLSAKSVLVVGCSMSEAECFAPLSGSLTCLDIVPDLTILYKQASTRSGLNAKWICGDGECLPFPYESFDVVIVRQSLHHMIRYYSAISELFRVCRVGGRVIIIEEPFSAPELNHPALANQPDAFELFNGVTLGDLRLTLGWSGSAGIGDNIALPNLESYKTYIPYVAGDPESLLADKYHGFSAAELIVALRMHTDDINLFWPPEIGWADHSGAEIIFCSGPNAAASLPLVSRLTIPTTVSTIAYKRTPTRVFRNRAGLSPASV